MFSHVWQEHIALPRSKRSISLECSDKPCSFVSFKQRRASDENEVVQVALKAVEQAKRSAESSPDNAPSRKRSAFGDITNVRESILAVCPD